MNQALRYSVLGEAHRIRPILLLAVYEALGSPPQEILPAAAGIELAHSYILILDDIVDNGELRRGKMSCWKKFGFDVAIYCTLLLADLSWQQLVNTARKKVILEESIEQMIVDLRRSLIDAQLLEKMLRDRSVPADEEALTQLYELKAGELFGFITRLAAIYAGAQPETHQHLYSFGFHLGMAYQIQDDIADKTGSSHVLGKFTGMDAGLKNFVTVLGLDRAKEIGVTHAQRSYAVLSQLRSASFNTTELVALIPYISGFRIARETGGSTHA